MSRECTSPIDVPTRETVTFVTAWVAPGDSVLEVGCGRGHVAAELERLGVRITGIDANPETVAAARERGFAAVHAEWPAFDAGPVDAIAFTRSLHHIGALEPALDHARDLLKPGGRLLVEDFAFDEASEEALRWFAEFVRSTRVRSMVASVEGELVTALLEAADPVEVWRERHARHELHGGTAMMDGVRARFAVIETRAVSYFYRYLMPVLTETREAVECVEEALRAEARLAEEGAFVPVGRRIVGERSG